MLAASENECLSLSLSLVKTSLSPLDIHGIHEHPKSKNDDCKQKGTQLLFCTMSISFLFVFSFWQIGDTVPIVP